MNPAICFRKSGPLRTFSGAAAVAVSLPLLLAACGQPAPAELIASAKTYLAKNDRKAAVIQIKNALQADPASGEARYLLGNTLLEQGAAADAEVELRKAQRLDYSPDRIVPALARSLIALRQPKKLIDEFRDTRLSTATANAALATQRAKAHVLLGDSPHALASLDDALAADPRFEPALVLRTQVQMSQGKLSDAANTVSALLEVAPKSAEAWKLKGDVDLLATHDAAASVPSYRKAVELRSDFVEGRVALLKALLQEKDLEEGAKQIEAMKAIAPRDPQVRYFEALLSFLKKDTENARAQAAELLKATPESVPVLLLAGSVEMEAGASAQAELLLERALTLAPENAAVRRALALTCLRSGQPAKAVAIVSGGRGDKPMSPELYSVAGEAYAQTGDVKTAQSYFEKAARLDPNDPRKRASVAIAHLAAGDAAGWSELQSAAMHDPGTSSDVALVMAYLHAKLIDKALSAVDAMERKQPGKPSAPYLRGTAQLAQRDVPGARKSFEAALGADPTFYPALAALTSLDLADRKWTEARARIVAFLVKEPKNAKALLALARVEALGGASTEATVAAVRKAIAADPADAQPRLALIELYNRAKDPKQAMAAAQAAVAALPANPAVLEALGVVQLQAGETDPAIVSFKKLAEAQPNVAASFLRLAQAQVAAKSPVQAEQSLLRALAIRADFVPAQLALAGLYANANRAPEALRLARTMQTQRPTESVGYKLEADIAGLGKDQAGAIAVYRAGLRKAPSSELAVGLHSLLLAQSANAAQADRFATDWQRQHPDDALFILHLGDQATRRNDLSLAEAAYLKVTQLQPHNAAALNNLSWTQTQLKKSGALALAERANEIAPGQAAFMDTLALALAGEGNYARAIEVEKRAIELQPSDPAMKFKLAKFYLASGDKQSAQAQLRELERLGPAFADQTAVSQLLRTL